MKHLSTVADYIEHIAKSIWDYISARLLIILLCLPLVLCVVYAVFRAQEPISPIEIRLFASLFLIATLVGNFAFLRLYNAIVNNSKFLFLLKKELRLFSGKIERFTTSFTGSVRIMKTSLSNSQGETGRLITVIERLNRILKKQE
jgi:hypothetical protein